MRDEFSSTTKIQLANRVAWRCSFPNCKRITIGPNHKDQFSVTNLGEAAHIHAASPNGPRYDPQMTSEQRSAIENGIWLCKAHARLIDSDHYNYSSDTLKNWKKIAEEQTYRQLMELSPDEITLPETLVSISGVILFSGTWKSVTDNRWTFTIGKFFVGTINDLREYSSKGTRVLVNNYIIVESQGDGRLLNGSINWSFSNGGYEVEVLVEDKLPRTDPNQFGGDLALGEDNDLVIENGDFKIVKGMDCAIQTFLQTLSISVGDMWFAPEAGSLLSKYYWEYRHDPFFLNRILKIEITRLISIPIYDQWTKTSGTQLNFINRILDVEVLDIAICDYKIPLRIKLEWGNGVYWEHIMRVFVNENIQKP